MEKEEDLLAALLYRSFNASNSLQCIVEQAFVLRQRLYLGIGKIVSNTNRRHGSGFAR